MARASLLFVLGAAAGAAAAYGALQLETQGTPGGDAPRAEAPGDLTGDAFSLDFPALEDVAEAGGTTAGTAPGYASARLAAYETAAAADAFELETLIDAAARRPASRRRDMELGALLARLAELEPRRAAEVGQALRLETRFLVPVFTAWAAADADAAIAALGDVLEPAALRTLALAVLDTVGNDADNVARVASALPESDRTAFSIDALGERARRDPGGALAAAIALDNESARALALRTVADTVAAVDPLAALAAADAITDSNLRLAYTYGVIDRWATTDPAAVFAYLEAAPPGEIPASAALFSRIATSDPERLLAMVDRLQPAVRRIVQRSALQALAARNPLDALARLESMPQGQERANVLESIAQAYGRQNPDAALAWAKAQPPSSRDAMSAVLRGIAEVDFDRALDLLIAEAESAEANGRALTTSLPTAMLFPLVTTVGGGDRDYARVADRLVSVASPGIRAMMASTLSAWSQTDPENAVAWAIANAERLDASALSALASQTGETNVSLAASTLDRLPPSHREAWLNGVVNGMAQTDPGAALRFIEPYRGQPGYDQALGRVITRVARDDPAEAARLLAAAQASPLIASVALTVARGWAARDPAAAAQYALTLPDAGMRETAARGVADAWARNDADAAQRWALSLPSGELRDSALSGYLGATAAAGVIDTRALAGFSNDRAREAAASGLIIQVGRTNPAEARRLLDLHITNPDIRRRTEEQLARTGGSGDGTIVPGTLLDAIGTIGIR